MLDFMDDWRECQVVYYTENPMVLGRTIPELKLLPRNVVWDAMVNEMGLDEALERYFIVDGTILPSELRSEQERVANTLLWKGHGPAKNWSGCWVRYARLH